MRATALAAVVACSPMGMSTASAHGYTDLPASRQQLCARDVVTGCGPVRWEPQSVEGRKGFPAGGPADGEICSGGHPEFRGLDDPRNGSGWPATALKAGTVNEFRWRFTARHSTSTFKYYITKNGWDPSRPLARNSLQSIATYPFAGKQPPATLSHQVEIPWGLSGRHIVLAVWDIADTGNAFYACSDVEL
ncbi:lytic polysaccharide monooxygenase [Streptomyces lavendulae]|uniref:lytic polysaccharide monooxygenase auxiliary activity family 9 protein n=1 Tax=Streptomyces lavendulae TaxID=1914 RepID=UPI003718C0C5